MCVCVCVSMESWVSAEDDMEDRDWPELLSDTSVVGGAGHGMGLPRLKRGQGSRHLGVDMTFNPDSEEGAEHGNKCFTSSGGCLNTRGVLCCVAGSEQFQLFFLLCCFLLCRRRSDQTHPDRRTELLPPGRRQRDGRPVSLIPQPDSSSFWF